MKNVRYSTFYGIVGLIVGLAIFVLAIISPAASFIVSPICCFPIIFLYYIFIFPIFCIPRIIEIIFSISTVDVPLSVVLFPWVYSGYIAPIFYGLAGFYIGKGSDRKRAQIAKL